MDYFQNMEATTTSRLAKNRPATALQPPAEQALLTTELEQAIRRVDTKTELEDLYRPYRPKRRTRATTARERGLGPLADRLLAQPRSGDPRAEAR